MFLRLNEINTLVFTIYNECAQNINNASIVMHREDLENIN